MSTNQQKSHWGIITAFMLVPLITSVVSTIHVVSFFELSNYYILSLILALAFELGALAALGGLIVMDKINKSVIWFIFVLLTVFQMVGNTYYAYDTTTTKIIAESNLIKNFSELFGFISENNEDVIFIKRIIALITGGVLPVISLSFLHLLMSYVGNSDIEPNTKPLYESTTESGAEKKNPDLSGPELNGAEVETETVIEPTASVGDEEKTESHQEVKSEGTFDNHLSKKHQNTVESRKNYFPLLKTLFLDGTAKEGDELPSYSELMSIVGPEKYSPEIIRDFLIVCNFLDITKMSGEVKKALMSYEQAQKELDTYLS